MIKLYFSLFDNSKSIPKPIYKDFPCHACFASSRNRIKLGRISASEGVSAQ